MNQINVQARADRAPKGNQYSKPEQLKAKQDTEYEYSQVTSTSWADTPPGLAHSVRLTVRDKLSLY